MAQNKQGKEMSSRLLSMKFMSQGPNSSPSTPPESSAKRQRMSNGSYASTPSSTPRSDAQRIEEAKAAEEQKRTEAVEREGAQRGETKWYLSLKEPPRSTPQTPLRIISAGFSTLDASTAAKTTTSDEDDDVDEAPQEKGRRSFGKFNRAVEEKQNQSSSGSESDSESSDDEDADESDDPTGAKAMINLSRKEAGEQARMERKAKRTAEKVDAERMADDRRKKQVKLNNLTSISGGGGGGGGANTPTRPSSDTVCYNCGQKGHLKRFCPAGSQGMPKYR